MTDFLNCNWDQARFMIFSENVYDSLIYYSHLLPLIASLILGLFVFLSNKKLLINKLFFILTLLFSTWVYFDLILWATGRIEYEMFFWAIIVPVEFLIFITAFFLTKKFISDGKVSLIYKTLFGLLFLPILLLTHSKYNLTAFDYTNCDRAAIEGPLITYLYIIEGIIFLIILGEIIYSLIKDKDRAHRIKSAIFSLGIVTFLGLFIIGNVTLIQDMGWGYEQYKLFGMIGFILILTFLIVRFKTFDIKLIGAQALVWALIILVGSQFFYQADMPTSSLILTMVTLLVSAIVGLMIVRSVKKEVALREELEIANNNQQALIHFISHQIKGFFTKSKMIFSGILEGDFGEAPETFKEMAKVGLDSDNNAVAMVQDILGASNLKTGTTNYNFKLVDLTMIVNKVLENFKPEMEKKGLKLETDISTIPLPAMVDETQMTQVFKNLTDNSLRYTPSGEIKVSLQVNPADKKKALFVIKDTGVGLSEKDKAKLFTEGGKGEESLKVNTNSTGYGLYIVKKIVESHKGHIWAESAGRGHGSKFCVELPVTTQ